MTFPASPTSLLASRTVLQIIPDLDTGGAERTTIDVAEGLVRQGARALVATEGGRLIGELQTKGGLWIRFPARTKNPLAMLLNVGRLVRLLRREKVDVIHARSRAPAWVALAAARLLGLPFVTTYHGSYSGRSAPKLLYNSIMARGDVVIANSVYTAEMIQSLYRTPVERLRVIHRGTDLEKFTPAAVAPERVRKLRKLWLVTDDQRVVLLAARLTHWKGQRVLIEAASILAARGLSDVTFVLAGDAQGRDSYVKALDELVTHVGLAGIVRRVGHVADMPAALLAAAVVAVPSTLPEAFGRVAVEAQAMGTPVVVSNLGAVPETVLAPPQVRPEARTGWRVPPSDPEALADALQAALALRPSAREAMATRSRGHVEAKFSLDRMVSETLDVYSAILEKRRAPG